MSEGEGASPTDGVAGVTVMRRSLCGVQVDLPSPIVFPLGNEGEGAGLIKESNAVWFIVN